MKKMIKKIKSYMLVALTAVTFAAPALVAPISASAACSSSIGTSISDGVGIATATKGTDYCSKPGGGAADGGLANIAQSVVGIFSLIVGVVAVIMIIYGGFRYITSGGDSGRVGSAKNSLIYAIVGLIIVALAQLIVHFVLNQTSTIPS